MYTSSPFKFRAARLKLEGAILNEDDGRPWTISGIWHGYSMVGNDSSMVVNLTGFLLRKTLPTFMVAVLRWKMCHTFQKLFINHRLAPRATLRQSITLHCNEIIRCARAANEISTGPLFSQRRTTFDWFVLLLFFFYMPLGLVRLNLLIPRFTLFHCTSTLCCASTLLTTSVRSSTLVQYC